MGQLATVEPQAINLDYMDQYCARINNWSGHYLINNNYIELRKDGKNGKLFYNLLL